MKLYIKAVVSLENLKQQFGKDLDDDKFNELVGLDPTASIEKNRGGKYCPWIFKQHNAGKLDAGDYSSLRDALSQFSRSSKKFRYPDLGRYKTAEEFIEDSHAVNDAELTEDEQVKLFQKQAHAADSKDKKCLATDGGWELWMPLTYPGSISLAQTGGSKARWCTAYTGNRDYYDKYTRTGPLYIFINMSNPKEKYQSCPTSTPVCGRPSWFFNPSDHDEGARVFCKFLDEHPAFAKVMKYKKQGKFIKNGRLYQGVSIAGISVEDDTTLLDNYRDQTDVIVPDELTSLGVNAFADCTKLCNITIPSSIRTIENEAFARCTALEHITIPDTVAVIGPQIFEDCTNLKSIKLSNKLAEIPAGAFINCTKLVDVPIPDSVKAINSTAFKNCTSLTNINIPNSVKIIEPLAFQGCDNLAAIDLPNSMSDISSSLFYRCSNLTDIKLPNNLTKIQLNAFYKTGITSIDIPASVTSIGNYAFGYCRSLEEIDIPDSVTELGDHIFSGCSNLRSIRLSNSIDKIPSGLCSACSSLYNITIPDSVTSISRGAFDGCSALRSITIPDTVVDIHPRAFMNCDNLTVHIKSAMWDEDFEKLGIKVVHS